MNELDNIQSLAALMISETRRLYPETADSKSGKQMARLKSVRETFFGYGYSPSDIVAAGTYIDQKGL